MTNSRAPVLLERREGLLLVTLNRPKTGNLIDDEMASALREAAQAAIEDPECAVMLLTAAGGTFCAGSAPMANPLEDMPRRRVADAIALIPKPLIAAIQGDAIGQGLELALACDLRVAAASAHFAMDHISHGMIPWDGGTQRLPRLAPKGLATEMVLTGRSITAQEAREAGLIADCLPDTELSARSLDLALKLAGMAPIAAAYTKEAILKGMDLTLEQGARVEADLAVLLQSTHDRAEGIRSFIEKRKPKFAGA